MKDISKAIKSLSDEEKKLIFNDGHNYMAFEIIYPPTKNVIDYGNKCLIQLHGVNIYDEKRLADIIFKYGEDKFARKIARAICRERQNSPIETTTELSDIIKSAFPPSARFADKHPAKRTFQALRIEVNGELDGLNGAICDFVDILKPGGRLAVITFHSLEDRIVKRAFADLAKGCTCPKDFPVCVCGKEPTVSLVNRKPIVADKSETDANYRAHSAKLRVAEKL